MAKKVLIDLGTTNVELRTRARTIAVDHATGLRYAGFNEEHGDLLVVIADTIDEVTAVANIRNARMRSARLNSVSNQN